MSGIAGIARVPLPNIGSTILSGISKFFSGLGKAAGPVASQVTKKATIPASNITRNIAITGGTILGSTLASSLFLSTPAGQNTLTTVEKGFDLGRDVTGFFSKNPIVPIGLLVLGGLIVVSVIKK